MIILVTGSRNWTDYATIHLALTETIKNYFYPNKPKRQDVLIVHGGAKGADSIAGEWARERNIKEIIYKPDWDTYGKRAGILRNQQMIDESDPDIVLAFWKNKSRGTKHAINYARSKGKEVIVYESIT